MPKGLYIFKIALLLVIANFVSTKLAFAHQQKAAETTVLFNKRSGQLEVSHRFYMHDTEHAVLIKMLTSLTQRKHKNNLLTMLPNSL
jgi:hypothetical protein